MQHSQFSYIKDSDIPLYNQLHCETSEINPISSLFLHPNTYCMFLCKHTKVTFSSHSQIYIHLYSECQAKLKSNYAVWRGNLVRGVPIKFQLHQQDLSSYFLTLSEFTTFLRSQYPHFLCLILARCVFDHQKMYSSDWKRSWFKLQSFSSIVWYVSYVSLHPK